MLRANGHTFRVIGIAPEAFRGVQRLSAPFSFVTHSGRMRLPGWSEENESLRVPIHWVSDHFFRVLGATLLAGRTFTSVEAADSMARSAVLNRTAAERLFGTADAVGRTVRGGFSSPTDLTVIGVVEDVRHGELRQPIEPALYLPLGGFTFDGFHLLVRTHAARAAVELPIRSVSRASIRTCRFSG